MKLSTILSRLNACSDARAWAKTQPDLQTAWANCKRADWMLWLIDKSTIDQDDPRLRLMACDFAEAVLHLVPAGEERPRRAIEMARAFARGEATREDLAAAGDAASAGRAAAWAAAWDAASAGRAAAWAAWDAAWDAWDAAWAAAWDAAGAAGDAARAAARADQSDIIRGYFPVAPAIKPSLLRKSA